MGFYIIYKIYCNDCNDIYVGSTQNYSKRKSQHRINSRCSYDNVKKRLKLYKTINEYGGWDNWIMVPIEFCDESITTKRQAEQKEEEWRLKLNTTLNSQKAYTSVEEKKDRLNTTNKIWREENKEYVRKQRKEYREQNKDKIREQKANDYEKNKEKRKETMKNYREENKDKIREQKHEEYERNKDQYLERAKIYKEENKDKIKERRSQKIECECGVTFSRNDRARHCRSKHHQNWINKEN